MKYSSHLLSICILTLLLTSCAKKERVKIETEFGDMVIELRDDTPQHKANFLKLVEEGFYNDLLFHRVMQRFMIQGGDPQSKDAPAGQQLGMGGPGYTVPAEFSGGVHMKGAVAAARLPDNQNPDKNSSGSQFYIVDGGPITEQNWNQAISRNQAKSSYTADEKQAYINAGAGAPFLDGEYTVFGRVVEGLEVIDKISALEVDRAKRPLEDVPMKASLVN